MSIDVCCDADAQRDAGTGVDLIEKQARRESGRVVNGGMRRNSLGNESRLRSGFARAG